MFRIGDRGCEGLISYLIGVNCCVHYLDHAVDRQIGFVRLGEVIDDQIESDEIWCSR